MTSSGLSHTQADLIADSDKIVNLISARDSEASDIYLGLNYGTVVINSEEASEIKVHVSIKDINGVEVIKKDYLGDDLSFKEANFEKATLCVARAAK